MGPLRPLQMKAAAIDHFGGPEVVQVRSVSVPQPGPGEILVEVDTAGIGVWDPYEREGGFDFGGKTRFPHVLGSDGAGQVVAVGEGVRRFKPGDRVYGCTLSGGFYAEYARIPEDSAAPVPRGLTAEQAGVLATDGITGLCGLEKLQLQAGDRILIYGASGGIGHLAVQLAKRMGAHVLAVASGTDGVTLVKRLGADAAVEGHSEDVVPVIRSFAPDGLDGALILAGSDDVDRLVALLRDGGTVAFPHGVEPQPTARVGITMKPYDGEANRERFQRLNELIAQHPFHVQIDREYDLDDIARAHRELAKHHLGKLALRIHRA